MINLLGIRNFKSIKEEDFELTNLTLFSGLNGMGKSSALQSLLLLRQAYDQHLLPDVGISLTGKYVNIGIGRDLLYTNAEEERVKIEVGWDNSYLNLNFDYDENSDIQPINGASDIQMDSFSESLFTSSFQYLSAERISPKSVYDVSEYAVNQLRSLGTKGEYTAHYLSQHGNEVIAIDALQHANSTTPQLIDNLNAWMSEITPGTKVITKLIPEINQASLHYQFSSSTELTDKFRPENTGFGLTYVLPVVTALLSAREGDLLIIENPESHLHPSGQSVIAQMMAIASQNNVQIIIETHSDHILNGVRSAVKNNNISTDNVLIYFLSRDLSSSEHSVDVEKIEIDSNGRIDSWPAGFFDEWDKSLNILLEDN
ncbi:MAG: putative ATPase [Salibacteraceae bacterium]|jgi:predicted ATPase